MDTTLTGHYLNSAAGTMIGNTWQHVALTYDKTTGMAVLYRNGVVVASASLGNNFTPWTSVDFFLGVRPAGSFANHFNGMMDESAIYKRALSASEIQAIYNAGSKGKFSTSSTLPYLDTDQDGIPDFWEDTFTTNLVFTPSNDNDRDGDGYTDLEEYNDWLAAPHALTVTNTSVGVDLQQMFGQTGNLSFFLTNAVNGSAYLTNVLGSVTNTGTFSNSIAVFTPTNNYSGYASFDVYVTNNDTVAYFGPVTVSVVVSKVPVAINSNMPPVITTLISGVLDDPTNYGGSDFYKFTVTNTAVGVLFTVTNASGPVDLLANYGLPLPSLSSYEYISTNSWTTSENILVLTNSMPVPLTNGDWYLAVVNVAGSNVTYDIKATQLLSVYPPLFKYPTNNVFTNIETTPFTVTCQATDTNSPPLPLTYAIVTNVLGSTNVMTINSSSGIINWTPNEAQGPSTNSISVSVSNGAFSVTNNFTIIVEESNLPPFWPTNVPSQTNYIINALSTLTVMNTATDTDIPVNPLAYTLSVSPAAANATISTNGIITWTPTLAQAGNTYLFTTVVTDTNQWAVNSKSLSATNYIFVTVLPPLSVTNGLPQTNSVGAGGINWYLVNVPTNAIAATNILLYATNLPVNVLFTTNSPPTTNAAAYLTCCRCDEWHQHFGNEHGASRRTSWRAGLISLACKTRTTLQWVTESKWIFIW